PQAAAPARGGALRGAALGAIVGSNSKKGAAIGAGVGAAAQGRRNAAALDQQREAQAQVSGDYAQKRGSYNNAYSACLTGRDYTVSPK
ncbi:MAG: glycine zipper domain-containing protein, partial [Porticoccus sp.]|nr:glycine zipper domain-containing protein [Porticoccus sp.]